MVRLCAFAVIAVMLGLEFSHAQSMWASVAEKVLPSIVSVQLESTDEHTGEKSYGTACSGFAIDAQRQLFMTAAHCRGEGRVGVNHEIAWVVYENATLDLMVLQSVGVSVPALTPRTEPITTGLAVAGVGHAYGFELPQMRTSVVSHPYMMIPPLKRFFLVFDQAPIGGQSGGPIVDASGNVVGIIQMGNAYTGLAQPIEVILKASSAFWAR